ncbi:MAG: AAA family ATPase [Candidatus Peribacteraceae bacterium]|nr:AAA family ATPase [Candidatus Peribacteraceae bacterium]
MSIGNVRVSFSGSGGVGKTTTLKEANKTLKLPVIKEGVRKYMAENDIDHLRELAPKDVMKMQLSLLRNKEVTEGGAAFIADRSTLDNFVYANQWLSREDSMQRGLKDYMMDCFKHAAKSYDYIFVFPWGVIPLEDDGVRSAKPMYQLQIQMLIERAVHQIQILNPSIYVHVVTASSVEDRAAEVIGVIENVEKAKTAARDAAIKDESVTVH